LNFLLIILLSVTVAYSKKDFYYSYINKNKEQLEQSQRAKILNVNSQILSINKLLKNGDIDNAYKQILSLRNINKIKILNSSIELLYAQILYKKKAKKFSVRALTDLEKAINNSIIKQSDLLEALRLLVNINIKINKLKDARFYANTILSTFKDPISQAYGKIALSKVNIQRRDYARAIKILYKILIKTKNLEVATIVADQLFDAYILNKQNEEAYSLTKKVLDKNINYYSSNSYIALIKINKLLKANMPHLAIKILKELLKNAKQTKHINNFKFKLANIYMSIFTKEHKYILKAKELYKDIVRKKKHNIYQRRSKMYLDEILVRQNIIAPPILTSKYPDSKAMYNRSLLQELLNHKRNKEYEKIDKLRNVYLKITKNAARRFGYKNIKEVFDEIYSNMLKDYLDNSQCQLLNKVMYKMPRSTIEKLVKNKDSFNKMFECMLEYPNEKSYRVAKKVFKASKNMDIYFNLEKIALLLNLNQDAYLFSLFIDKAKDKQLKSDEFLYRFIIYSNQNNSYSMDKFFSYAKSHKDYIKNNQNDPRIIDFYYQYYLYLIKKHKDKKASNILKNLYDKQNEMDAHIYSPFVEMQLSLNIKLDDNYTRSIKYLEEALNNTRTISDDSLAQIYYDMAKSYKKLNKQNRYKDTIKKCKNLKNAKSLYKSMCNKL
jgi:hypothetical protein